MSTLDPKTHALDDLTKRILATELAPGMALDETHMAKTYALSRTPLREVLQRLAGQGYVVQERNRGAKVAPMDIKTMRVFFQTAPMVYAAIGQLAAETRTPEQLSSLKTAQRNFCRATAQGDTQASALANHVFHQIIGEMAQNPYLTAALDRLLIDHTRLSQTFYRPKSDEDRGRIGKASQQHDAMIAAIEAQEPAVMVDLTLKHWDLSRDRMEAFVRPDPLPIDIVSLKDRRDAV